MTDLFEEKCPTCGRVAEAPTTEARFAEFWEAYPSRNGRKTGKAEALKHYRKAMQSASEDVLIGSARAYAESGVMPVDAFRWLRDRRWVDESPAIISERSDVAEWWADLIRSDRRIFSPPASTIISEILKRQLVSMTRLRERGLA